MTQPTLINLHPNKFSQEFHYYSFAVILGRCVGSCNTFHELSNKVCGLNQIDVLEVVIPFMSYVR